ncbi:MAG TPA: GWxTD domain-containing protein [Terriglobales bacterium]|nr:GWxTD domain-containing protein [Terriglobales bacterium]
MKTGITGRRLLVLAALAAAVGSAAAARASQSAAKLDAESEKFYQVAHIIMSGDEAKIWKHLPDAESRKEFIRDFWEKRDPDPDTEANEFKMEFEARVAYANKHFKEGGLGMNTDRGRIYIFLGPPEKTEDFLNRTYSTTSRGSSMWWLYYKYGVGVQFVDERGYGAYKISQTEGNIFEAMDLYKLGQWVGPDSVFKTRVVDFGLKYDEAAKELVVLIPAKSLLLKENAEGKLEVDLAFKFYLYEGEGSKREVFTESRSYVSADVEYEKAGNIPFRFARPLPAGKDIADVIVTGREGGKGKVRKIFDLKVTRPPRP